MKRNKHKSRMLLAVLVCLVVCISGASTSFADTGYFPDKGWDRLVGGASNDQLNDVVATNDGGTVSVGVIGNDAIIVKMDERGTVVWKKQIGGTATDSLAGVVQLADGSLLAVGYSYSSNSGDVTDTSYGGSDGWIVKLGSDGHIIWNKLVGGNGNDSYSDLILTTDGGFLAVGNSTSSANGAIQDTNNGSGNEPDGYIVKFDGTGDIVGNINIQWDNLFGSNESDRFYGVIQTSDGGFVAAGTSVVSNNLGSGTNTGGEITDPSPGGVMAQDGLLVKFNASGSPVWNNLFGSTGYDDFFGIAATADGGFVVAGRTSVMGGDITTGEVSGNATALIAKFGGNGAVQWNRAFTAGNVPYLKDIMVDSDGGYVAVGTSFVFADAAEGNQALIAKITAAGSVSDVTYVRAPGDEYLYRVTKDANGHLVAVGKTDSSNGRDILSTSNGRYDGLLVHYGETLYNITIEENGGSIVPNQNVRFGNLITQPISTVRPGYTLAGWFTNSNFSERFALNAPVIQDSTMYAKWYLRVMMNSIISTDDTISGTGQPNFSVIVTLPNGTKVETYVAADRKWSVHLPKGYQLKGGDKVNATMYDIFSDGVEVSSDQRTVAAGVTPPETGDNGMLIPFFLFLLLLSITVMIGIRIDHKAIR